MSRAELKTVKELMLLSAEYLSKHSSPSPRLEAELLLAHCLGYEKRLDLYMFHDKPVAEEDMVRMREYLRRRVQDEPTQYIIGHTEFYGLEVVVGPGALIPRPETERLVDFALEKLKPLDEAVISILDLCTGTGCIPLALEDQLKNLEKDCKISASDISSDALHYAQMNKAKHKSAIELYQGDLFGAISAKERFHLITANPPYIGVEEKQDMGEDVLKFEPELALMAEDKGLEVLRRIAREAKRFLHDGAWLMMEFGWRQGDAVLEILQENEYEYCEIRQDYNGHDRIALARWQGN